MKKFTALLLSALLLTGCSAAPEAAAFRQITQEEAAELISTQTDLVILDVRTPEEFASGHIPGAINVPNETISQAPVEALPRKDQTILVYCRSGNRSKQASRKLSALGYTDIREFGGVNTWPGALVTD